MNQLSIAAALVLVAGSAIAQPTITLIPSGFLVTDLSHDGSVAAGNQVNDGSYETFRWDAESGAERLGRATVPFLGTGAGSPDISLDGTRISATILASDGLATLGIWDSSMGWSEVMPPLAPGASTQDSYYGAAWGLSGDGLVVTGLNYGGSPQRALACTWSQLTGLINYPQTAGMNARLNAANFDGSVVTGWVDSGGPWWATAWRNGVKYPLVPSTEIGGGGQGHGVSSDGSIVVGGSYDPMLGTRVVTMWTWDGVSYVINRIGMLPGTVFGSGQAYFSSVSDDGQIAVGSNIYTNNPGGLRAGVVWTPGTGLVKDTDYLASLGLLSQLPPNFEVREFSAVSPDGSTIAGIGLYTDRFEYQSFLIQLNPPPACPGDANGDFLVDGADLSVLLSQFGQSVVPGSGGDLNGDGGVDGADLSVLLSNFGGGGCI